MLKKLKWRFVCTAMIAFGAVMFVLAAGINVMNSISVADRQDEMTAGILEYEQMKASQPEAHLPMISEMPWSDGPEADFTTRFFVAHCDAEENVVTVSQDHISSIDRTRIQQYVETILAKNKEKGHLGEYRYRVGRTESGTEIVFLDISRDRQFVKSLLWTSAAIVLVSLLVVFALLVVISNRAILPYVKNMERQKRFITDAGHELKTPLTSITASADILAMEYEEDEWVENIQKQTVRLTQLVKDLVALSRLDEETPFPEKAVFSVSDAAWEIAEPFASLAKAEGKTYSQHIEEGVELTGDRNAVQQMISILLDNAVKYSRKDGEIRFQLYRRHHKVCIEVFNTCELPENADLNRLFDRFYRLDASRSSRTGGTGIGLSMAQAIAKACGGKITVKRSGENGIVFTFVIRGNSADRTNHARL